jgi:hypothetical protein
MVGHKTPGIHNQIYFHAQIAQPDQKIFPICINAEYSCSFNIPLYYTMQGSRSL